MADAHIPVRLSHLLRHCSVGAIVRGPESLMVVPDIREWHAPHENPLEGEIRYVDQVRGSLGITQRLCRPPVPHERAGRKTGWIPALRFPTWMRCLKCGLLHRKPWKNREIESNTLDCQSAEPGGQGNAPVVCSGQLEQVPWVLVHEEGFLADVPWHDVAHAGALNKPRRADECRRDWEKPYLKLTLPMTGRPKITCTRCRSRGPLEAKFRYPAGTWQQPWLPEPPIERPGAPASVMEINDVRVHSPATRTALVIPPESRILRGTVVDRLYGNTRHLQRIRRARNKLARISIVRRLAGEYGCAQEDIEDAIVEIEEGYPLKGKTVNVEDLRKSEYAALTDRIPDLRDDEDFVTRHQTDEWKALRGRFSNGIARCAIDAVDHLVAVDRLKEIMVFKGFSRDSGDQLPPDIIGESEWLPAVELYGEGVFFTLDEAVLARWEASSALHERTDAFALRYYQSDLQNRALEVSVTPRLLLCHTLAHLLIRQLESFAGYPGAALKERLYCWGGRSPMHDEPSTVGPMNGDPMAGILLYVAVADEEGSLGGLAELAEPGRFLRLLTAAMESANWCSLDPVCGEREGHGPSLLNGASCHACALVAETSCEHGNTLLDRTFIKGDGAEIPAFLDCVGEGF